MKGISLRAALSLLLVLTPSLSFAADFATGQKCYDAKDYACALKEWQPLAEQGDAQAQASIGAMYYNGNGTAKNKEEAVKWWRKATDQGHTSARTRLGAFYLLAKNYQEAVKWLMGAGIKGDTDAQYLLGTMYENGEGFKQDFDKALFFYKESGNNRAYASLKKRMSFLGCKTTAKTTLFDVPVKCANRNDLRAAVKNGGAAVKGEDLKKWGDSYDSSNVLKGTSELRISYTVDDLFAKAVYTFPSRMDAQQIAQVRDFVANKYGQPDSSSGQVSLGNASFDWVLQDGIELSVSRGWPNTTTYLSYVYPEHYKAMTDEQERQRKAREAKQYEKQGNAF